MSAACAALGCANLTGTDCHCARCHQTFGGMGLFDAHQDVDHDREPPVICRDPSGIRVDITGRVVRSGTLSLVQDERGVWQSPAGMSRRQRTTAQLAAARERIRP